jgi:ubiquinone/menaquinone biosynthesis C-methylase UbiE
MKREQSSLYREPRTLELLQLKEDSSDVDHVVKGSLSSRSMCFPIVDGIPIFLDVAELSVSEEVNVNRDYYQAVGDVYDKGMDWLFSSFFEDEERTRARMVDLLECKPDARVLETGCGTCRDSTEIRSRLGPEGELFVADLSVNMLQAGRQRLENLDEPDEAASLEFLVADAEHLPFGDDVFDAAYHFGGINVFDDVAQGMREMARVVKPGGKVVVGDEGIAPWLRGTEYARILENSNSLYSHSAPLTLIPQNAKEVRVNWLLGNAFYVIDYRVGASPPQVDMDLEIPGRRGGTHRTRYFGSLEGVDPDVKALAERAALGAGKNLQTWIEQAVKRQAESDLKK